MSSPQTKDELKAGHPPAMKAGGMRISQHRRVSGGEKSAPDADDEEFQEPTPPTKGEIHNQQSLVSGVVTKGDRDFPAEAVRHYHDKPQPTKQMPRTDHQAQRIQQPR